MQASLAGVDRRAADRAGHAGADARSGRAATGTPLSSATAPPCRPSATQVIEAARQGRPTFHVMYPWPPSSSSTWFDTPSPPSAARSTRTTASARSRPKASSDSRSRSRGLVALGRRARRDPDQPAHPRRGDGDAAVVRASRSASRSRPSRRWRPAASSRPSSRRSRSRRSATGGSRWSATSPTWARSPRKLLAARGHVEFRKGAVCAIDVDGATPVGPGTLRWLLPPRVLAPPDDRSMTQLLHATHVVVINPVSGSAPPPRR